MIFITPIKEKVHLIDLMCKTLLPILLINYRWSDQNVRNEIR